MEPSSPSEGLRLLRLRDLQKQIQRYYSALLREIDAVGQHLEETLTRHEEDYLAAFKTQIVKVEQEVRSVRLQMESQRERFDVNIQVRRLAQANKDLDAEANRLALRIEQGKQDAVTWKLRSQEFETHTLYLARRNQLLRRQLETVTADKSGCDSVEFSPTQHSTKASVTPFVGSSDSEERSRVALALGEVGKKYGIVDAQFIKDIEEMLEALQRPFKATVRHLRSTLSKAEREIKKLRQEDLHRRSDTGREVPGLSSSVLSPLRTPIGMSFRVAQTPCGELDQSLDLARVLKAKTPSRLRRKISPVVIRGKLMLRT